ncbi:MAG: hypothetical protein RL119_1994, partial [Actinomycetota bacterium]
VGEAIAGEGHREIAPVADSIEAFGLCVRVCAGLRAVVSPRHGRGEWNS